MTTSGMRTRPAATMLRPRLATLTSVLLVFAGVAGQAPVARGAAPSPTVVVSAAADRSAPRPLYGAALAGPAYVFVAPVAGITRVAFYLDDPERTGAPRHVENTAPFDLGGGSTADASPLDTTALADGTHQITVVITLAGTVSVLDVPFDVANPRVWPARWSYRSAASQPYSVSEAQGVAVRGKLYQFGGFDSTKRCCTETARSYVYDPTANTWTALAPMPGGGVTHAGVATDGRYVYLAGGYVPDSTGTQQRFGTTAVWRYDTVSGTWAAMPSLPAIRSAGALVWRGGVIDFFGGQDASRTVDTADHFVLDVAAGAPAWRSAAPMPQPRNHLGAVALGGLSYAIGGQTGHDSAATVSALVQVYDPSVDAWHTAAPLPLARSHMADSAFVQQGRIIVAGGSTSGVYNPQTEVDAYDPATGTWTVQTPLPGARMSMVAADVGGGSWFATGGDARNSYRVVPGS